MLGLTLNMKPPSDTALLQGGGAWSRLLLISCAFLWKRIANSFTAVDIIDLFGWNKGFLSIGGAILSAGAVGFSGAPWSAVIAVGLLAGCFILLLAILYQVWKLGVPASPQ